MGGELRADTLDRRQGQERSRQTVSATPSQRCMRDLGTGAMPTGYKLMRRGPHTFNKGPALDQMDQIET